ncbi:MAG: DUF3429 domain-containing protein [Pseudomonadota bacterium]
MTSQSVRVPSAALWLGLAGVLPFAWGALTEWSPGLSDWTTRAIGPRFAGQYVQVFYGAVILSFMSGVLWGFATRAEGKAAAIGYSASVVPALWVFFFTGGGADRASVFLLIGFLGLLGLDWAFWRAGLTPPWWMRLRVLLTGLVAALLLLGLSL